MSEPLSMALAAVYADLAAAEVKTLDLIERVQRGQLPSTGAFARARTAFQTAQEALSRAEGLADGLRAVSPGLAGVSGLRSPDRPPIERAASDF